MTRIPHLVFGLLLGLVLGAVFYFFLHVDGPLQQRLLRVALFAGVTAIVGWFMAARVRNKPPKEQGRHRLYAIALMLLAIGATAFADYKAMQHNFMGNCTANGDLYVCRCIERRTGPRIWFEQLQQRPQIALGRTTRERVWASVSRANGPQLTAAARACASSAQ